MTGPSTSGLQAIGQRIASERLRDPSRALGLVRTRENAPQVPCRFKSKTAESLYRALRTVKDPRGRRGASVSMPQC